VLAKRLAEEVFAHDRVLPRNINLLCIRFWLYPKFARALTRDIGDRCRTPACLRTSDTMFRCDWRMLLERELVNTPFDRLQEVHNGR
jgi:hypothetical protein